MRLLKILKRKTLVRQFKPVVLVTGCSSGVGLALARSLAKKREYRVVVTSRPESLSEVENEFKENDQVLVLPLDVTSAKSREEAVLQVCEKWGTINILINNAGISYRSVVEHMDTQTEFNQMQTNYLGPMALTRLVLPLMRDLGRGKIINISSVSGMLAMPTMASYSASKYALEGASEALWYEMRPLGINVTLIQPGFIRSKSFERVYYSPRAMSCSVDGNDPYCDYYQAMEPFIAKMMGRSLVKPEAIAKLIIKKVIKTENPPL